MMKIRALVLGLVCASSFLSRPASAQVLGNQGDAIFGAERLFGIRDEHARFERDAPTPDAKFDTTTISLGVANALLPVNVPRLSFDYLVARKFSVGGAIGYSTNSFDASGPGGPVLLGGETRTFLFNGRLGFLHMFGRVVGIWPRGGLTYHSTSVENGEHLSDFGVNLECQFPFVIAPHFGILLGVTYDQSLTGTVDPGGNAPDYDYEYRSLALQFGLFGWI